MYSSTLLLAILWTAGLRVSSGLQSMLLTCGGSMENMIANRARGELGELCDEDLDEMDEHLISLDHNLHMEEGETIHQRYLPHHNHTDELLLITVASNSTDGFQRFERSARVNGLPLKVLGMGQKWGGGDMKKPGGGYKINLLKEELEKYKDDSKRIIMFTDGYDVIIVGNMDRIIKQFLNMDARIVFSAEGFCWPDESLASKYPTVARGKRYLNSGGFIGYASELYQLVTVKDVEDTDDDQLYYTNVFLDPQLRNQLGIKLDHRSLIFQNLYGVVADVELRLEADNSYIKNTAYATTPLVLHGNGPSKTILNSLGNYVAKSWTLQGGCYSCDENQISLSQKKESELPFVVISVFIHQPTPFLEEFFNKIAMLDYPKSRLAVFVHNSVEFHTGIVDSFLKDYGNEYRAVKTIDPSDQIGKTPARELAMDYCIQKNCDAYLNVDSEAHLDNPKSLRLLLEHNRGVVGPVLSRPFKAWSNFWGALSADGFYARSADYMEIVNNERRGLWNVPYLSGAYLVNATLLAKEDLKSSYSHDTLDPDMAFCHHLREKGIFMFVTNTHDFGHLVNAETFDLSRKHPDFYMLLDNRWDWEQKYLHPDYASSLDPKATVEQPCPDVYWFPVTTPRFCKELIEIMENFGKWSDGSNKDDRLSGGYENVPTRDIHMNQVGLEPLWLEFLKAYVRPLVERVYIGYSDADPRLDGGYEAVPTRDIHMRQVGLADLWDSFLEEYVQPLQQAVFIGYDDAPRSLMNFVVRYRPDEQPSLRPHHDSSTYTINLALNRAGIDYQGGGCNFLRYNCSVKNTRVGWLLMHPGRLTHFHEGLPVTNGTRYIMISFVDP